MLIDKYNNDIFKKLFYDLFNSYEIVIKNDYQFVYDDFFDHLVEDTINEYNRHAIFSSDGYSKLDYKKQIFKKNFYIHYSSSQWHYKVLEPEKDKEIIKKIRNKKLKYLYNGRM